MVAELSNGELAADKGWSSVAGTVIIRVLFPLWLGAGALFKLANGGPSTLPVVLVKGLGGLGVDLMFVLGFAIAVELTVIGLIWLVAELARPAALAILGLFMVILVVDISMGAASCGCFGSIEISPWFTLVVDGLLLVGALLLGGRRYRLSWADLGNGIQLWRVIAVIAWALLAFALAFGLPAHRGGGRAAASDGQQTSQSGTGSVDEARSSARAPAVPAYYLPEYDSWIGQEWQQLDLAAWIMGTDPEQLWSGTWYVLFYRKDCEHCHELMEIYFAGELGTPTLAVAVPEKDGFPTAGAQPMVCSGCARAELPAGCDWFFATPVLVRLQDGVVECAAEVDPGAPECLQW